VTDVEVKPSPMFQSMRSISLGGKLVEQGRSGSRKQARPLRDRLHAQAD
jgi:hypothetical protein